MIQKIVFLIFIFYSFGFSQGFVVHTSSNNSMGGTILIPSKIGFLGFRYMQFQNTLPGGYTKKQSIPDSLSAMFTRHHDYSFTFVFSNTNGICFNGKLRTIGKIFIGPSLRIKNSYFPDRKQYKQKYLWYTDAGGGLDIVLFNFLVLGGEISIRHFFTFNLGLWF